MSTAEAPPPSGQRALRKYFIITGTSVFLLICGFCGAQLSSVINRGKQVRTQGDMKTIASALNDYLKQYGHYPVADSIDGLMKVLSPEYLSNPFIQDGWHNKFRYEAFDGTPEHCLPNSEKQPDGCGPTHFTLASAGSDGEFEFARLRDYHDKDTHQFQCDIVLRDDEFLTHPFGKQEFGRCAIP